MMGFINKNKILTFFAVMAATQILLYFIFQGTREAKSAGLCSKIPADKYQNCHPQAEDSRSFHDYSSEDIERLTNVSFSSEQYTGRVLLVVNLASF